MHRSDTDPKLTNAKPTDHSARERLALARESFSGRLLSNARFEEAIAITRIIEREIHNSGSFKDKLGDYAHAFARSERFDAVKADSVLRDLFKARVGQPMNGLREALVEREKAFSDADRRQAYEAACGIEDLVRHGPLMAFRRAYAQQAEALAGELGITDAGAKALMREEFKAVERVELIDWGKELEERYYSPQVEDEKRRREAAEPSERRREFNTSRDAADRGRETSAVSDAPSRARNDDAPSTSGNRWRDWPRRTRTGPSGP